jgi:hypothetical protein
LLDALHRRPTFETLCVALTYVFLYCVIGGYYYHDVEGWTAIESVYFCMVTMSTVGYGDYSPSHDKSKIFTLVWIILGIVVVFATVAHAVNNLMAPVMREGRALLEQLFPQECVDIDGDGEADYKVPRHPVIYYSKGMVPSLLVNVTLQLCSAAVFVELEGWLFGDAMYHCVVTATTVGYGDLSIATDRGKMWACAHILLSVCLLGELIGSFGDLKSERQV